MCICVDCLWVDRCKTYHAVEKQHCVEHLNLNPDAIADTVILVGDPSRATRVSKHFDKMLEKFDEIFTKF